MEAPGARGNDARSGPRAPPYTPEKCGPRTPPSLPLPGLASEEKPDKQQDAAAEKKEARPRVRQGLPDFRGEIRILERRLFSREWGSG